MDKWSNRGQYGFKIKIDIKKQKVADRSEVKGAGQDKVPITAEKPPAAQTPDAPPIAPLAATMITPQDMAAFRQMLKGSVALDMA